VLELLAVPPHHFKDASMKHLISLLALSAVATFSALAPSSALAKEETKQQGKMATCNKEAVDKKGDERKAFMKECLSAKPAAAAATPAAAPTAAVAAAPAASRRSQGSKLGACSKEAAAKGLKGAERNAYLSECGKKKD